MTIFSIVLHRILIAIVAVIFVIAFWHWQKKCKPFRSHRSKPVILGITKAVTISATYLPPSSLSLSSPEAKSTEIDPSVLKLYRQQVNERKKYLTAVPELQDYFVLYNTLVPEVFCRDLVRIGFIGDGGKWICNPSRIRDIPECVVYSLGIANEPSFEESFQNFTQYTCLLRSLDKDAQNQRTMERITAANGVFMKALITSKTDKAASRYSLKDVLSTFGDTRIDILKIDIEGAEFLIQDELISG